MKDKIAREIWLVLTNNLYTDWDWEFITEKFSDTDNYKIALKAADYVLKVIK